MTTQIIPTIERADLNLAQMQIELQDSGAVDRNDTLYLAEILKKTPAKNKNNKTYIKFQLVLDGDQNRSNWNMHNGLDAKSVSGQILRSFKTEYQTNSAGEQYDSGELENPDDRWLVFAGRIEPHGENAPWRNVNQIITKVVDGTPQVNPSGDEDDLFPIDSPTGNPTSLENEGNQLMSDIESRETDGGTPSTPQTVVGKPKIPANDIRSISIERQVAIKCSTDITLARAKFAEAVINTTPVVNTKESLENLVAILDVAWAWVINDTQDAQSVNDRAKRLNNWIEYDK